MIKQTVLALVFLAAMSVSAGTASAASTAMPTCSAGDQVVWVNTRSNVYHRAGDPYYGKTSKGAYECESAARAAGAHLAGSKSSSHAAAVSDASPAPQKKHHHKHTAVPTPTDTP